MLSDDEVKNSNVELHIIDLLVWLNSAIILIEKV